MNIIVKTASGRIIVRPDTTWEKDNEDFFPPEFVGPISASPVLFARILKPGRSIGKKFASRYWDAANFGVLLYPEEMIDGSEESYAEACCIDHTSFLPTPLFQPVTIDFEGNEFVLMKNGETIFSIESGESKEGMPSVSIETIEDAIVEATKRIYIRTGDLIAIELEPRKPLSKREDGTVQISGTWCENSTIDFKINY